MSEQFNNKDYGDYFSALEKSVERKSQPVKKEIARDYVKKTPVKKRIKFRPWVYVAAVCLATTFVIMPAIIIGLVVGGLKSSNDDAKTPPLTEGAQNTVSDVKDESDNLFATFSEKTAEIESDIESESIIVVNCDTNMVVASRNATARCYPASTTKIMTILTAVDYITDYDKTFTFSYEITDPFYIENATVAGFSDGEAVNMTDMLYGAILPSGADATTGLAISVAGSEQEFVKLMNKKADELGLKDTHFTNASGLFDKNHYTTAEDMAVIIREAMKNDLCKKVLSTYKYTTAKTPQHPDGIELTSTLFSYMYGTEPETAKIVGGKTGFVSESGYCIASFGKGDSGTEYVCVTLKGISLWPTVHDQIDLYSRYAK